MTYSRPPYMLMTSLDVCRGLSHCPTGPDLWDFACKGNDMCVIPLCSTLSIGASQVDLGLLQLKEKSLPRFLLAHANINITPKLRLACTMI